MNVLVENLDKHVDHEINKNAKKVIYLTLMMYKFF